MRSPRSRFTRAPEGAAGTADRRHSSSGVAGASMNCGATFSITAYCLTGKGFSHTLAAMDADLSSLERKIDDVAAFCRTLRDENHALRGRVADLEQEKQTLVGKMEQARARLEALMERLPAE